MAPRRPLTLRLVTMIRGYGRNPLCRTSDLIEHAILWLFLLLAATAVPLAAWVGTEMYAQSAANATQYAQSVRETTATVGERVIPEPNRAVTALRNIWVDAEWTAPDGTMRTGRIPVSAATMEGARLPIFTTHDGEYAAPPPTAGRNAASAALASVVGTAAAAWFGFAATRAVLDRQRHRAWDTAWAEFDRSRTGR
jgi:type IV secretory pathway VirJ component